MFQRDYISRVIEEMAKMLARIIGLRLENNPKLAWEAVDEYYKTYVKFDRSLIMHTDPSELQEKYKYGFRELESLSALFSEEAELFQIGEQKEKAILKWERALMLLEYVKLNDKNTYSQQREERIKFFKIKLAEGK